MGKKRYKPKYTLVNFAVDAVLTLRSSGLWLIWVFVREMRGLR